MGQFIEEFKQLLK